MKLIACVPNFSEGRDETVLQRIRDAIAAVPGAFVLRSEMDPDHNRSVITFAGPPGAVREAAFEGIAKAAELIDLTRHRGVHPRIGAADVAPFVPLEGATLADCVKIARRLGQEVWQRLGIPVYFYEAAAENPERAALENIRRGGFESPRLAPDLGGPGLHPTAGGCAIGARNFLLAFNVNLATPDAAVARAIARKIRASSGGLPFLKAMGVPLASRNLAQVSMNLTNFERTGLHHAFEAVRAEAAARGVEIAGSEIVGLIPAKAFEAAAAFYLRCERFDAGLVLEHRLRQAMASRDIDLFLDELSSTASPKGGGSAAAAAGGMAAALGSKLCRFLRQADAFASARAFFAAAVNRDAEAFQNGLQAAPEGWERAAAVPLEVAEAAVELSSRLRGLAAPDKLISDLRTALALAEACRAGAAATARASLREIQPGSSVRAAFEERLRAIE